MHPVVGNENIQVTDVRAWECTRMTPAGSVHERLIRAVCALALGRARINERLADAHRALEDLRPEDWPAPEREVVAALHERLTSGAGPLGDSTPTAEAMSEDEAADLAAQILELEARLRG